MSSLSEPAVSAKRAVAVTCGVSQEYSTIAS